jgi:tetratricopeptide (TPR) repeat protein
MRKNLNRRKKAVKKRKPIVASNRNVVRLTNYKIVFEPLPDKEYDSLPQSVKKQAEELYDLIYREPRKAIPILLELLEKYPHIPQFYNFLNAAYGNSGEAKKADETALEIYQKFPDYLFGRANYALICLQKGEHEKIPEIFDNKLDLQLLFPERKKFHITEYTSFATVMALYYLDTGKHEAAKTYYSSLEELSPDSQLTQMVKKRFLEEKMGQLIA